MLPLSSTQQLDVADESQRNSHSRSCAGYAADKAVVFHTRVNSYCFSLSDLLFIFTVGVNVPDHDMTFHSLSDLLRQSVTPHVVSVQAKECAGRISADRWCIWDVGYVYCIQIYVVCFIFSALKHLMKKVLERLMDTVVAVDDDEEETEQTGAQPHKSVHCSLGALCDWYTSKTTVRAQRMPGLRAFTFTVKHMAAV